jgi:pyruvate,water dikinase
MTSTGSAYLIALTDPACTRAPRVGAKAATLATLAHSGFAVPDALVLTVDGFDAAAGGTVPEVVERALIRVADHFGPASVAVRSSAVDEDRPDASYAGQFETVLGVVGAIALRDAVQRCWMSATSAPARSYAERRGGTLPPRMAVVIQRQISPRAAGVAFTLHPVTQERDVVVIEAVAGLSASALAGSADPERWEVGERGLPRRLGPGSVLDPATARRVAELARRVEAHQGAPQDIEWAIDEAGLWLLQARPITAVPEIVPVPVPVEVPEGYWERESVHAPRPHTPMNRSLLNPRRAAALRKAFADSGVLLETIDFRDIGGWEYVRLVPPGGKDRPTPPGWLFGLLLRLDPALRRKAAAARAEVANDLPIALTRRWYEELRPRLAAVMARLRDIDLTALSDSALAQHRADVLSYVDEAMDLHFELHGTQAEPLYDLVATCRDLLDWTETQACELLSGLSVMSTEPAQRLAALARRVGADSRLRQLLDEPQPLARMADIDARFAEMLADYRRQDGFRAMRYEVAEPTLGESDDLLALLIRDHLRAVVRGGAAQLRDRARLRARQALAPKARAHRLRFETALRRAETVYPVREDNEFLTVGVSFALTRSVCREYGRRLADRGQIAAVDDIFYLELDEMRAAFDDLADRRDVVARRKGERAWVEANPGPPTFGTPPGPPPSMRFAPRELRRANEAVLWYTERDFEAARSSQRFGRGTRRLNGIAGSAGRYTGPVRVIRGESELHRLRAGDVAVCPVTSPVWSVAFPLMGALVTDAGGILSHPAIIAREYNLPAVVATGNATTLLHDGMTVTVDGSAGTIDVGEDATPTRT